VRLDPRPAGAFFAAVSDDGARAAIPDEEGLALYDLRSGARVALLHHAQASPRLAVSRDGRAVAELRGGALRVFTVGAAAVWSAPAEDTPHLALAPDGAAAAVCGDLRGGLTVFDLRGRRAARALPSLRCQGLDWSPDGRTLAATRYDGVTLVRVEDGQALELSLRWRDGAWRADPSPTTAAFFRP